MSNPRLSFSQEGKPSKSGYLHTTEPDSNKPNDDASQSVAIYESAAQSHSVSRRNDPSLFGMTNPFRSVDNSPGHNFHYFPENALPNYYESYPSKLVLTDEEIDKSELRWQESQRQAPQYYQTPKYSHETECFTQPSISSSITAMWSTEFSPEERLRLGLKRYEHEGQQRQAYEEVIAYNKIISENDSSAMSHIDTLGNQEEKLSSSITVSTGQPASHNQELYNESPKASLPLPQQDFGYLGGLPTTRLDHVSVDLEEVVEEHREADSSQICQEEPTNRVMKSKKYFDELETLEARVYAQSAIRFYKPSEKYSPWVEDTQLIVSKIPVPENEKGTVLDESVILNLCQETMHRGNTSLALRLWSLLECRNLLLNILFSCTVLQKDGFCNDSISFLVIDAERPTCVRLRAVQIKRIISLSNYFEYTVSKIITERMLTDRSFFYITRRLTLNCDSFLEEMGLLNPVSYVNEEAYTRWRIIVHVLELAILSYSGAHIEPFDERYLGYQLGSFQIPAPFFLESILSTAALKTIKLSRRSLQCLENFLGGKKVWVFSTFWSLSDDDERLYLVTEVDKFAEIWGPLWKECIIGKPEQVIRYKVGYGYIVPWEWDQIKLQPGEVCCHWCAEYDVPRSVSFDKMKTFKGTETLVIGAPYVRSNRDCYCSNQMTKQRLKESGLIQPLATYEASRYVEGETVEIAVGIPAKGFTGKYGRTYKRRDGHSLRLAFLESWEHPELNCLDPAALEHKYGVEISLSTFNARKVPLIRLLGSPSMLEYLRPYPWLEADCKTKYIDAVRNKDLKAFRRLWQSNPEWQEDIRKAVCHCLRALSETGVGIKKEMDALYVIWVPAPGQRHLVMLNEPRHKWTGFLKDSRDYFTMAVGAGECLDFTGDGGKCCGYDGYSVFETALMINDNIKPIELRKLPVRRDGEVRELCWSVSRLKNGELFPLGDRGALQFIKRVGKGGVLVKWKAAKLQQAKAQFEKTLLGRPDQRHCEHIEDDEELDLPGNIMIENGTTSKLFLKVKPLRVFLTADLVTPGDS